MQPSHHLKARISTLPPSQATANAIGDATGDIDEVPDPLLLSLEPALSRSPIPPPFLSLSKQTSGAFSNPPTHGAMTGLDDRKDWRKTKWREEMIRFVLHIHARKPTLLRKSRKSRHRYIRRKGEGAKSTKTIDCGKKTSAHTLRRHNTQGKV